MILSAMGISSRQPGNSAQKNEQNFEHNPENDRPIGAKGDYMKFLVPGAGVEPA
jgi:hypothetical protein